MSERGTFEVGDKICAIGAIAEVIGVENKLVTYRFSGGAEFRDHAEFLRLVQPADSAPTATDEAWIAEIRARVVNTPEDDLFVKANYNEYYMVRGVHNGAVFADVPITGTFRSEIQKGHADFIAAAPSAVRRLLDALDDARRERDAAVTVLRELMPEFRREIRSLIGENQWILSQLADQESDHATE